MIPVQVAYECSDTDIYTRILNKFGYVNYWKECVP